MAYKLRDRNQKRIYLSSGSSDSDSSHSDPDYSRTRPRRQPQQNNTNLCNPKQATDSEMVEVGVASSSQGRRRGRPPKKRVYGGEKQSTHIGESSRRRKRAPYSLKKRTRCTKKTGKTQTKTTILSWLIYLEIIEEKAEVWYMDDSRERILLKGMITRAGIFCHCCKKEITVWEFELHAESDLKRPYVNIFLAKKRVSLLECQLEASTRVMESKHYGFNQFEPKETAVDKNDDACMICADGGDLICCEKCPSTFHKDCMRLESVPQEDWLCPYCVCKYCGLLGYGNDELFTCSQCQKKYHWACYLEEDLDLNSPVTPVISLSSKTLVNSFCGQSCRETFKHLERIVGVRNEIDGGLSWSLIRQTDLRSAAPIDNLHQIVECNCKIGIVWKMMDQSFDTTIDGHTNINVVQSVVYNQGSNLTRINFQGFYTAILEKDDEIISAASLRIHGTKVAEIPFVATHENYRHIGMWRKLLFAIESALCFLKVEYLVIPSIEDLVTMWTEKYGFTKLDDSLMKELIFFNTLMFTKAIRLQKTLLTHSVGSDGGDNEAMEVDEVRNNGNPNGVDTEQNQANHLVQNEMEVDEVKDINDSQKVQNGKNKGQKLKNLPLFDLNLEPPEEGEILIPMQ